MEAKFAAALIRTLGRYADGVFLVAVMFASGTRRICNVLIKRSFLRNKKSRSHGEKGSFSVTKTTTC